VGSLTSHNPIDSTACYRDSFTLWRRSVLPVSTNWTVSTATSSQYLAVNCELRSAHPVPKGRGYRPCACLSTVDHLACGVGSNVIRARCIIQRCGLQPVDKSDRSQNADIRNGNKFRPLRPAISFSYSQKFVTGSCSEPPHQAPSTKHQAPSTKHCFALT
jgi:hypothetical protein